MFEQICTNVFVTIHPIQMSLDRHLVRHLLQHFPFLPGSKFKPRWLVPIPSYLQVWNAEGHGPLPPPVQVCVESIAWISLPSCSSFFTFFFFKVRVKLDSDELAALEAQTKQLLMWRESWRRSSGLLETSGRSPGGSEGAAVLIYALADWECWSQAVGAFCSQI